jgi:hypothetical protein
MEMAPNPSPESAEAESPRPWKLLSPEERKARHHAGIARARALKQRSHARLGHSMVNAAKEPRKELMPGVERQSPWLRRCQTLVAAHLADLGGGANVSPPSVRWCVDRRS